MGERRGGGGGDLQNWLCSVNVCVLEGTPRFSGKLSPGLDLDVLSDLAQVSSALLVLDFCPREGRGLGRGSLNFKAPLSLRAGCSFLWPHTGNKAMHAE
jgi:hypothetical protein